MIIKVQDARPGMWHDGQQVLTVDPNNPFCSLEFTRATGGGRKTFQWDQEILVETHQVVPQGDVVDADVWEIPRLSGGA